MVCSDCAPGAFASPGTMLCAVLGRAGHASSPRLCRSSTLLGKGSSCSCRTLLLASVLQGLPSACRLTLWFRSPGVCTPRSAGLNPPAMACVQLQAALYFAIPARPGSFPSGCPPLWDQRCRTVPLCFICCCSAGFATEPLPSRAFCSRDSCFSSAHLRGLDHPVCATPHMGMGPQLQT